MVIIYTTPTCIYCKATKKFFAEHDIEFEDRNVAKDEVARNEMIEKSEQMGVPVIDIDGEIVIGFNKKRLAGLLEIEFKE